MKSTSNNKTYKVGISGHRDLKSSEIPEYREKVMDILKGIIRKYESREISIITPLAEGADRLVAKCAIALGLGYEVLLPMPTELYIEDFPNTQKEFFALCDTSIGVEVLPLCEGNTLDNIAQYGDERDRQYLKVGKKVVDRSEAMLFLWDGVDNGLTGGTADIKKYAEGKNKVIFPIKCKREVPLTFKI